MSYIRFDYSLSGTRALHGLTYEDSNIERPINTWKWSYAPTKIYGEQEVYSPYDPVWREEYWSIDGYFEYNEDGSLYLPSATISAYQVATMQAHMKASV